MAGGTLTFALTYDSKSLDPQRNISKGGPPVLRALVDSLTDQDTESGEIVPWLAEKWTVNPESTEFTFTLQPDVTFSDGTPLDSAAVKANFDALQELGAAHSMASGYLEGYRETRVIDSQNFTVVFEQPTAQFLQGTSTISLGIISPASAALSEDERRTDGVIGSGPFVIESHTPDKEYVLAKRTGYDWSSSESLHTGEARLDRIVFPVVPESGMRAGLLSSGQVDGIDDVQAQDQPAFDGNGFYLASAVGAGLVYNFGINETRPFTQDRNVRLAIQYGIDRKGIVDAVLAGVANPATNVLASTTPGWTDASASFAYDPDRSQALLDEAGWAPGPDGIRVKDGQRLVLELPYFQDETDRLTLVQQQLKDIGIDLKLEHVDNATRNERFDSGQNDLHYTNVTRGDPDILRYYLADNSEYVNKVLNADVIDLVTRQAAESDTAQRMELVAELQQVLIDDAHIIPLWEIIQTKAFRDAVHDVTFDNGARMRFYDTWIQP